MDILSKFEEVEIALAEAKQLYAEEHFIESGFMLEQAYEELGELLGAVDAEVG